MQNLSPECQTLQNISVLFRMVVAKPSAVLSAPDSKAALGILGLGGMEIMFKVLDHAVARISVDSQESVVVPDAIETLSQLFLCEPSSRIFRGKSLDGFLLALDVPLDVPPRTPFRDDLLRGNGNKIVSEDVRSLVLF